MEAGAVWAWCAALPAVLMAAKLWIKPCPEPGMGTWLKAGCSVLALLAAWNVLSGSWPELMQFSLSAWHEAELWVLLGAGVLMMAGRKGPARFPVAWWLFSAGVCGVLLAYAVGVVAAVDVQAFPVARRAELMSGWVGMAACVHAAAMALCLAGSLCLWRPARTEAGAPETGTLVTRPGRGRGPDLCRGGVRPVPYADDPAFHVRQGLADGDRPRDGPGFSLPRQ